MNLQHLRAMLAEVATGSTSIDQALHRLRDLPFEDLGDAKIDHHRGLFRGPSEAIYAAGKTADQVERIARSMWNSQGAVLATRLSPAQGERLQQAIPEGRHDVEARVFWARREPLAPGPAVAVISAGTSDGPVAAEACRCLEHYGHPVERVSDSGVAGLHRLLAVLPVVRRCQAVIVVAGMEGALPSVVAGLVDLPVIAVPTSVGYGTAFGGVTALLGMLNSCAQGVCVVNIDNGFGAACAAVRILHNTPAAKLRATDPELHSPQDENKA